MVFFWYCLVVLLIVTQNILPTQNTAWQDCTGIRIPSSNFNTRCRLALGYYQVSFALSILRFVDANSQSLSGRLARDARPRDMEDLFYPYGRILRCDVKVGYGFIEFEDRRDAEDAIRGLNGKFPYQLLESYS